MDLAGLLAEVDARYAQSDPPEWPDPHPDRSPAEDEYSRVTDANKYRIVGLRAFAWVDALADLGLAPAVPTSCSWDKFSADEAVRIEPTAPAALSMTLGFNGLDGVPRAVLRVGVGNAADLIDLIPDCGCDACDSGSADLLRCIDDVMSSVVTGELIHVVDGDQTATHFGGSTRATGRRSYELFNPKRRSRKARVVHGASWLGDVPKQGRSVGVVATWHRELGWGVVDSLATPGGCWVHFSHIRASGFRSLDRGIVVIFGWVRVEQDGYSYRACDVLPI